MADPLYCPWVFGHPCLKPEVWAAWAQAVLSVAAIYAASRLATAQEKLAFRRRVDACVALLEHADDALLIIKENPLSRPSITSADALAEQLRSVTIDAAPDYRLIGALTHASAAVSILAVELKAIKAAAGSPEGKHIAANNDTMAALDAVRAAWRMALPVAEQFRQPSLIQRIKRCVRESKIVR
ncbi:hypothetical protein [Stenotrophomonas sp.]|uniref:hypothetical protein n=1 Tax=Stenotrophomonas sp. TaxID=69392 RepID=UPI0028AD8038|nr:hypothetical protein [Stenotrophomonas sp.]